MLIRLPSGILAESWRGTRRTTRSLLRWFLSSVALVALLVSDLVMFSAMVLRPPDRQVSLDCPRSNHQAHRCDSPPSDKVKTQIPLGAGSRFVQQVGPAKKKTVGKTMSKVRSFLIAARPSLGPLMINL